MIKLLGKLPRKITVACSGGVDSMVALDFLRRNHTVEVLYFNHGTAHGEQAEEFVLRYCRKNSIPFLVDRVRSTIPPGRSREDWWRNQRYEFFDKYTDRPVVTCHHLDDCVETWIFSSLNGTGKSIPYRRNHVVRPFLLNRKRDLALWANLKNVPHIEDDSNAETCYNRNYIRHNMMPHVLEVNPGIHKVISRKVREEYERE
jgi:tRNA(Ile)-lysidine synthase